MSIIAMAGEKVIDDSGNHLCTVAEDIDGGSKLLQPRMFTDANIDFSDSEQRFLVTLWLVRRFLNRDVA